MATQMIGRDAELEALQAAHYRLFDERQLAAVTVVAEAGIVALFLHDDGPDLADGETLDLLNYLAEVNRDVPLLVLNFPVPCSSPACARPGSRFDMT